MWIYFEVGIEQPDNQLYMHACLNKACKLLRILMRTRCTIDSNIDFSNLPVDSNLIFSDWSVDINQILSHW